MTCPACKALSARENDFCLKCGALVPRKNSDVAKYANYNIYGENRFSNSSYVKEKPFEKNILGNQLPSAWKEVQEIIKQQQNTIIRKKEQGGTFYGSGRSPSQQRPPNIPRENTSDRPPQYRSERQPVKTVKKRNSFSGFIIFLIIAAVFTIPNILSHNDYWDNDYSYNTANQSQAYEYTSLNYTLTDVGLSRISVTPDYVEAFTLSFKQASPDTIWYEPLKMDFVGEGEIVFADSKPFLAVFDGLTISVPKCNLDFNKKHELLYIYYYDYQADCEYKFFMPADKQVIIFKNDATYEFGSGYIPY